MYDEMQRGEQAQYDAWIQELRQQTQALPTEGTTVKNKKKKKKNKEQSTEPATEYPEGDPTT